MSVVAEVLSLGVVPSVRVVVSGVPSGVSWTVTGATEGWPSWQVASAVSDGRDVPLSDPWAPLGVVSTYTLTYGTTSETVTATRTYIGADVVTDLQGRVAAEFLWTAGGGDPVGMDAAVGFFQSPGSFLPVPTFGATAGAGGGSLVARTVRPHTDSMRELVRANRPVVLLHNTARCSIPGCDIAPARTVFVTSAPEDRTGRVDVAQREWALTYRLVPAPYGWVPPVATVDDLARVFDTTDDLLALSLTVDELRLGDWAVSGLVPASVGVYTLGGGGSFTEAEPGAYTDGDVGTFVPVPGEDGAYMIDGG